MTQSPKAGFRIPRYPQQQSGSISVNPPWPTKKSNEFERYKLEDDGIISNWCVYSISNVGAVWIHKISRNTSHNTSLCQVRQEGTKLFQSKPLVSDWNSIQYQNTSCISFRSLDVGTKAISIPVSALETCVAKPQLTTTVHQSHRSLSEDRVLSDLMVDYNVLHSSNAILEIQNMLRQTHMSSCLCWTSYEQQKPWWRRQRQNGFAAETQRICLDLRIAIASLWWGSTSGAPKENAAQSHPSGIPQVLKSTSFWSENPCPTPLGGSGHDSIHELFVAVPLMWVASRDPHGHVVVTWLCLLFCKHFMAYLRGLRKCRRGDPFWGNQPCLAVLQMIFEFWVGNKNGCFLK